MGWGELGMRGAGITVIGMYNEILKNKNNHKRLLSSLICLYSASNVKSKVLFFIVIVLMFLPVCHMTS